MADTRDRAEDTGSASRRALIPTEREASLGAEVPDFADVIAGQTPEEPVESRATLGDAVRNFVRDMRPANLGGPLGPILILGLYGLVSNWDDSAIEILLPELRTEFSLSLQFLIVIVGVLGTVGIALGPLMGYLADRASRVWMLRIGSVLMNIASIWFGFARGIGGLFGSRAMKGVGEAVRNPVSYPLLSDYYPIQSRARVFSTLYALGMLGAVIGPTVAGQLAGRFGWRAAVVSLGIVGTVASVGFIFLKEPKRGYWERKAAGLSEDEALAEQPPLRFFESFRACWSIATVRRICYALPFMLPVLVLPGGGNPYPVMMNLYWIQVWHLGIEARGYIGSGVGLVSLVGIIVWGAYSDRLLRFRPERVPTILSVFLVILSIVVLLLSFSPFLPLSLALSVPISFLGAMIFPAILTMISLIVPARVRGLGLQVIVPFILSGLLILGIGLGIGANDFRRALWFFTPAVALGALILSGAAVGLRRDIRSSTAVAAADEETRKAKEEGKTKMLVLRDVDVDYDGVQVVFGVDLDVEEGEVVALVGTNGSGKSTLLSAISGMHPASAGAIFLDGRDITHIPTYTNAANGIVMVPGGHAIFPTLTVEENLRTAAWMYREEEEYVRNGMDRVLNFFPILRERFAQQAGNLSGGEQQMVALGQAFLMKPRILMIDELSLGLAPAVVEQLLNTVREIHEHGTTIILVEQSLNVALEAAERAVFMEKGEVRFDGAISDLLRRPELVRSVFMGGAVSAPSTAGAHRPGLEREKILVVEDLSVGFGGVQALNSAGIEVAPGEVVGVIGPNGAGKTTLFDIISGFVQPDSGRVVLDGTDITNLRPDARAMLGLGRSFQNVRLFPAMTVRENIAVARERHIGSKNPLMAAIWAPKLRKVERRVARFAELLIQQLGLEAYGDKFVTELSTGTRRAVDIACVMASEPRVLLLDEPSSGLAQAETEDLGPLLLRLVRQTGCGMLVIEHDVPLITSISDRMYAMDLGAVVASGTAAEVQNNPVVVTSYLAASKEILGRSDLGRAAAEAFGIDISGSTKKPTKER